MYTFRRLRGLLQALSVARLSRRQLLFGWLWTALQCVFAGVFVAALIVRNPHDSLISWHDITSFDAAGRAFLISSYVSLATGCYLAISIAISLKAQLVRRAPPPNAAAALRQAASARDPRIAPAVAQQPSWGAEHGVASSLSDLSFAVAAPDMLTRPLLLVAAMLIGSAASFSLAILFASTVPQGITYASLDPSPGPYDYFPLWPAGFFLMVSALALASAWRSWNAWSARGRGVEVKAGADGLTIRGPLTLWRPRFIPWRDAQSLARIVYNDTYTLAHTVYMLDAGSQTLLWESPPDNRSAAPARRATITQWQASAEWLVMLIITRTGLPLLDISGKVNEVAQTEPVAGKISLREALGEMSPQAMNAAMVALFDKTEAEAARDSGPVALPPIGVRLEQWRVRLDAALVVFAVVVNLLWFFTGLGR